MTKPESLLPELAQARADIATLNNRLKVIEGQRNESMNREVVLVAENAALVAHCRQLEAMVAELQAGKAQSSLDEPTRRPRGRRSLGVQTKG